MAEQKYITYVVEVDTRNGLIKIDGLTDGFEKASTAAKRLRDSVKEVDKNLGQGASKAGLAGAAITELGRTISDSNYGMTAMANNLQQLSTLMVTLISTSGGLWKGLKLLGSAFFGPLGLIVGFQILFAYFEKQAIAEKETVRAVNNIAEAYKNAATELEVLRDRNDDLTANELENINIRISALKEEAKVRAQIAEIQRLQSELIKLEQSSNESNLSWWKKAMFSTIGSVKDFLNKNFAGAQITKGDLMSNLSVAQTILYGEGGFNKEEEIKKINGAITEIIDSIDVDVLSRLQNKGKDKRGKDQEYVDGIVSAATYDLIGVPTPDEMNKLLTDLAAGYEIKRRIQEEDAAAEKARLDKLKADREADLEHRMLMFQAIGDGVQSLGYVIGRETQAGKAIMAAGALIETYSAITKTLNAFAGKAIPGYAIAQAVATGLFGFAQVKKIYETNVPSRGGGGGGAAGAAPTVVQQQPSFNIVGQTQGNQIRDTIQDALGKPIRAYVTTRDIRSGEELDRNIVRGATVG